MPHEIERKFLVDTSLWQPTSPGTVLRQGYLSSEPERTVRVRLHGDQGKLTIKGKTTGVTRSEFEYDIPAEHATALLELCERPWIDKVRHRVPHEGKTWEVDVFHGDNEGLILAELELASEDESFSLPPWATQEVSHDPRYYNANLIKHPFRTWS